MADADYARAVAAEFVDGLLRAGTTTALVFGAHFPAAVDPLFERAADGRAAGQRRARGQRPAAAPGAADHPGAGVRRRASRSRRAGTARTGCATPSRPRFSLSTSEAMLESCAAVLRDVDGALFTSHINENGAEIDTVRGLFPEHSRLHRHLPPVRAARAAQRAGAQRASRRRRAGPAGRDGRGRRALPVEQQRAGQRPVPAAPARRAPRAGGAGHRRGRRHGLLAAAGGPAGVLRAVAARRRTGCRSPPRTCSTWPPGPGRRRWTSASRSATCRWGSSSTRSGSARTAAAPSTSCSATRTTRTTPWRRCSRWAARRTSAGCGSAATGCADAAVYGATSGSRDSARIWRASWGTSASAVPRWPNSA